MPVMRFRSKTLGRGMWRQHQPQRGLVRGIGDTERLVCLHCRGLEQGYLTRDVTLHGHDRAGAVLGREELLEVERAVAHVRAVEVHEAHALHVEAKHREHPGLERHVVIIDLVDVGGRLDFHDAHPVGLDAEDVDHAEVAVVGEGDEVTHRDI